jgi:NADPH2:quinone reductase
VAVTTSSAERGDRLGALGATHVLDRAGVGGEDAPAGYDVIIDIAAGFPPADFGMELFAAFQRSLSFATFSADTVPEADRRAVTAGLFAAASRAELRSVIHEVLPLERAVRAHQKMEAGGVFGRIVLEP